MRKILTVLIMGCLLGALMAAPAGAARKKVVKQEWDVIAAPFPGADDHSTPSEECGVEGVNHAIHTYKTPAKGKLDARINGFQGEWDLYVTDSAGRVLGSSVEFMSDSEERVLISIPARTELLIYACNFAGGPIAHGELKYVY